MLFNISAQLMPDRLVNNRIWTHPRDIDSSHSHYIGSRNKTSTDSDSVAQNSNADVAQAGYVRLTNELKQTRILLAESEKELQSLFKIYLDSLGADSETVDDGNKALAAYLYNKEDGRNYDAIVLDTHLNNISGLDVAKKIHERDHSQKIILITTRPKGQLPKDSLKATAIEEKDILVMPFKLSNLAQTLTH